MLFLYLCMYIEYHTFTPGPQVPVLYHRVHSSFLFCHTYNSFLFWWESWISLSLVQWFSHYACVWPVSLSPEWFLTCLRLWLPTLGHPHTWGTGLSAWANSPHWDTPYMEVFVICGLWFSASSCTSAEKSSSPYLCCDTHPVALGLMGRGRTQAHCPWSCRHHTL